MYTAGVSAQYRVVPQVYLTAGYRWVRRDSNEAETPSSAPTPSTTTASRST